MRPHLLTDEGEAEQLLLTRIRGGDLAAFGELVQLHLRKATGLAFRLLHNRAHAEELVQDAFLSALRHVDDFEAGRPFWPWLSRIIINRVDIRARVAFRSASELDDELVGLRETPLDDAETGDVLAHFRRALDRLSPRRRLIVELFELEGFAIPEIADALDMTPSTVRWHLYITRRQLRQALAFAHGRAT